MLLAGLTGVSFGQVVLTGAPYFQNFDGLSGGVPTGWSARTGATATALGSSATVVITPNAGTGASSTNWGDTSGRFFNAASVTGLVGTETGAVQAAAQDRALAIRQTGSFGDPGAAFALQIADTLGYQGFTFSFAAEMQSVQTRTTTWTVDYGIGASPTSFTALLPTVSVGTAFGETLNSYTLPAALDNVAGPIWIRIVALSASSGTGSRDSFGIDNVRLDYSVIPTPGAAALIGLGGLAMARRRRA
jgi:hypothetical protein